MKINPYVSYLTTFVSASSEATAYVNMQLIPSHMVDSDHRLSQVMVQLPRFFNELDSFQALNLDSEFKQLMCQSQEALLHELLHQTRFFFASCQQSNHNRMIALMEIQSDCLRVTKRALRTQIAEVTELTACYCSGLRV